MGCQGKPHHPDPDLNSPKGPSTGISTLRSTRPRRVTPDTGGDGVENIVPVPDVPDVDVVTPDKWGRTFVLGGRMVLNFPHPSVDDSR